MEIVHYPHPALSWKSAEITQIDDALRQTVRQMFDLMYEAKGIGLAANQVALPFRFFIANLTGEKAETEEEIVFINPQIIKRKGTALGEEGCLSLPGLYADVKRSATVVVEAFDLDGQLFRAELDDLGARAVQHEIDHLDGIMFIERLEDAALDEIAPKVAEFVTAHQKRQAAGELPGDEELRSRLKMLADGKGNLSSVG